MVKFRAWKNECSAMCKLCVIFLSFFLSLLLPGVPFVSAVIYFVVCDCDSEKSDANM